MWQRILCDWFGYHKWTFNLVQTKCGSVYHPGRVCERCGAAQRAIIRSRLVGWEDVDEVCNDNE